MDKDFYTDEAVFNSSFEADNILKDESTEFQNTIKKAKITKEKIKHQLEKFSLKAKVLLENKEKLSALLTKAALLCAELSNLRLIGKHFKDITVIIEMVNDYVQGIYTQVPKSTIITLVAAVLYFLSPIDLIPDALPIIGHFDDVLVFLSVKDALERDINRYKNWKQMQADTVVIDI